MTKISQLSDIGGSLAAGDEFVVRDVSDISTPNKKVTASGFIDYVIAQGVGSGFTQISAGATAPASVRCVSSGTTREVIVTTSGVERARFTTAGQLRMAGAGITFNGDTATANELDDYEEGVWTPVLTDGTNNATTNIGTAQYTKIGNVVHLMCYLVTTSLGSVTGALRISGLPFTVSSNSYSAVTVGTAQGLSITAGQSISIYPTPSQTYIQLFLWDATDGVTALQASEWTADGGTIFSVSYRV